jgi:Cu(I)/Ag(I) efflux system periplasmic protein CusF
MEEDITMFWHVIDPAMLKTVKPGDADRFVPERINGDFTIVKIEKLKQ